LTKVTAQQQADGAKMFTQPGTQIKRQLQGYRLTTAEILYHLPDHPRVLQSYIWQELDIAPRFPVLHKFLDFWTREIEGKLHSVRVASVGLISPAQWRHTEHLVHLH
jgi:uncharacterized protein Usg